MRRLSVLFASTALLFSQLIFASPTTAIDSTPRVLLSDYTPYSGQQVRLYFEGLEPYTQYGYGYLVSIYNTVMEFPEEVDIPNVWQESTFTTDSEGKRELEIYWEWYGVEPAILANTYLGHIYVNPVDYIPADTEDFIAESELVIPSFEYGLQDLNIAGPALSDGMIQSDSWFVLDLENGINPDFDIYNVWGWVGDDNYFTIMNDIYENFWANQFHLGSGEISPSDTAIPIDTPSFELDRLLVYFFSTVTNEVGWIIVDGDGNKIWMDDPHDYGFVESQVKPYSYIEGYFGSVDTLYEIQVTTPKKCFAHGRDLIFLSEGKCSWKVNDAQSSYIYKSTTTITKAANAKNSKPLKYLQLKFSKGQSKLTSKMMNRIEDFVYDNDITKVFTAGHAAAEGTLKSMKDLAKARTISAKNYLRIGLDDVYIYTGMANGSASGSAVSSRRVDIVQIPEDQWAYDWQ